MSDHGSTKSLPALFGQMRESLAKALAIAKATEACAAEGYVDRALTISLDIEDLIYSANHLLQAAAGLNRSSRRGDADRFVGLKL